MGENERIARAGEVYDACRLTDRLFALNPFLPQQNFYSQQLRALALVEIIAGARLPVGKRNVLVVGGGVGGRMLAAAFSAVGASVRLVESRQRQFERYRGALHRELHPNIIFWPTQEPTPVTNLPFLNWAQAPANEVVGDILAEWDESFAHKVAVITDEATAVHDLGAEIELHLRKGQPIKGDLCVLAMGFKSEHSVAEIKSPSYWSYSSVADEADTILVSGSGDGGVIDALSPILGTNVTRASHVLAISLHGSPIRVDILTVEADRVANTISGTRDSSAECDFYLKVSIPPDAAVQLGEFSHSEERLQSRTITFVYDSTSLYSFSAAPINKLLLSHFCSSGRMHIKTIKGRLLESAGQYEIACADGSHLYFDPEKTFDKVIVRHGAKPGVSDLLSDDQLKSLRLQAEAFREAAIVDGYNHELFRWNQSGVGALKVPCAALPRTVRRAINHIGRAYGIDLQMGPIGVDHIVRSRPVVVNANSIDRRRARELKIFPLNIGATVVKLDKVSIRRNAPYEK